MGLFDQLDFGKYSIIPHQKRLRAEAANDCVQQVFSRKLIEEIRAERNCTDRQQRPPLISREVPREQGTDIILHTSFVANMISGRSWAR